MLIKTTNIKELEQIVFVFLWIYSKNKLYYFPFFVSFLHWKEPHFGEERSQGDFDCFYGEFDSDTLTRTQSEGQEGVRIEFVLVSRCPPVLVSDNIQPNEWNVIQCIVQDRICLAANNIPPSSERRTRAQWQSRDSWCESCGKLRPGCIHVPI